MFNDLLPRIQDTLANGSRSVGESLKKACEVLQEEVPHYDWVGFYFRNGDKEELKLGPYAGDPTDHTVIPFGKGICGQVALSNSNFVVPDVNAQDNYIACSIHVKSEIVIPIFVDGANIGQIDIDSHRVDPFTKDDEVFLEAICKLVSGLLVEAGISDPSSQLS